MNKLIIITQPRTGSSWLATLLGYEYGSRVLVEPIAPLAMDYFMRPNAQSNVIKEHILQTNLRGALANLLESRIPDPAYGVTYAKDAIFLAGFKTMIHQIKALPDPSILLRYIVENNVKILINYRRDLIAQYVSEEIAKITHQAFLIDDMERKTAKITIDVNHMKNRIHEIIAEKEYILSFLSQEKSIDIKTIFYEDYCDDISNLNHIAIWAAGKVYPLKSTHRKQRLENLEDVVTNYDDIKSMYSLY